MSIHDRIRAARKDAGLSVNAFAKKVGVSSTAAWNWDWENTTPTPDKLPKIASVLGVSVADLTGLSGKHDGSIANATNSESLDEILRDAGNRIAVLLKISPSRVVATFNLK